MNARSAIVSPAAVKSRSGTMENANTPGRHQPEELPEGVLVLACESGFRVVLDPDLAEPDPVDQSTEKLLTLGNGQEGVHHHTVQEAKVGLSETQIHP